MEKELAVIDVPVLLLWGRNDPFQSWDGPGERLRRHLPHADVELLDHAGHFPMLDRPDAYAESLLHWLNSGT